MARPSAGRHQHHVEADGQAGQVGVPGDEGCGSAFQPLALPGRQGAVRRLQRIPRLDLDDDHGAAALGHDVDLPLMAAPSLRQDAVALQPQRQPA